MRWWKVRRRPAAAPQNPGAPTAPEPAGQPRRGSERKAPPAGELTLRFTLSRK